MSAKEEKRGSILVKALIEEVSAEIERNGFVSKTFSEVNNFTRDVAGIAVYPPVDVIEELGKVIVTVDLPGFDAASTNITVEENILTIKAQRSSRQTIGGVVHRKERPDKIIRRIHLPISVEKGEKVGSKTNLEDGVLEIQIENPAANVISIAGPSARASSKKSD